MPRHHKLYSERKFEQRLQKSFCFGGGKGDTPDAPDYTAAAKQTGADNLALARLTTIANRPNEYTPLGSRTWTRGGTTAFDAAGYEAALKKYNADMAAYKAQPQSTAISGGNSAFSQIPIASGPAMAMPVAPNKSQFINVSNPDQWTSNINLTPEGQRLFDSDLNLKQQYADLANTAFGKVQEQMTDPSIDESKLVANPIDPGQSVMDAYMSRMEPMFERQQQALETQLANQGIFRGSKAWNEGIDELNRGRTDSRIQASQQSIAQALAARQAGLQEQAFIKDRPLNTVNALRSGSQVALPQFTAAAQMQTPQGADYLGAAKGQYDAGLDAYNAKVGSQSGFMNGLFGLGAAYLTGGGSAALGAGAMQLGS